MREIHEYIRTMRTALTVQSNDEYLRLRKYNAPATPVNMAGKADKDTIEK